MRSHDPEELVDKINTLAAESAAKGIIINATSSKEYWKTTEEYRVEIKVAFAIPKLAAQAQYLIQRNNTYLGFSRDAYKATTVETILKGEGKDIKFCLYLPDYPEETLPSYRRNIWDTTINGIVHSDSIFKPVVDEKVKDMLKRCYSIAKNYLDTQIPEIMTLALSPIGPRQKGIDTLVKELDAFREKY